VLDIDAAVRTRALGLVRLAVEEPRTEALRLLAKNILVPCCAAYRVAVGVAACYCVGLV
jgi:hypothetical protein